MPVTDYDRCAWFLVALVAITQGAVLLDELALELAQTAPMGSC